MTEKEKKPMSTKAKLRLALVIIIILGIAALILIPRYNQMLRDKSAAEGKAALEALRLSVDNMWKSNGTISGITLDAALDAAEISPKLREKWQFAIAWKSTEIYTTEMVNKLQDMNTNDAVNVSPYRMIMVVAKADNRLREGSKIWFMGDNNQYHGNGIDDKVEPDWNMIFPNP
ncbi:MAG TPA: hypothetical protein PLX59_02660 [Candidatus Cloacimonadota bacterium]|nr:hypothetical protein [Candidatus Cloacimonadota bacterium]